MHLTITIHCVGKGIQPNKNPVPNTVAHAWNSLPTSVTASTSSPSFKRQLKTFLFTKSFPSVLFSPCNLCTVSQKLLYLAHATLICKFYCYYYYYYYYYCYYSLVNSVSLVKWLLNMTASDQRDWSEVLHTMHRHRRSCHHEMTGRCSHIVWITANSKL